MKNISVSFSGRCRIVVDGKVQEAEEAKNSWSGSFQRVIEVRDLDAPENYGEGAAQRTPEKEGGPG